MRRYTWKLMALACVTIAFGIAARAQQYGAPPPGSGQQQFYAPVPGGGVPQYEQFAPNLGIYYRLVPYPAGGGYPDAPYGGGHGPYGAAPGTYQQVPYPSQSSSFGARLTRYPIPGSPAASLQLEPGDMVVSLDNLPISSPNDVLGHRYDTNMVFVNIRTGLPQSANVYIP